MMMLMMTVSEFRIHKEQMIKGSCTERVKGMKLRPQRTQKSAYKINLAQLSNSQFDDGGFNYTTSDTHQVELITSKIFDMSLLRCHQIEYERSMNELFPYLQIIPKLERF